MNAGAVVVRWGRALAVLCLLVGCASTASSTDANAAHDATDLGTDLGVDVPPALDAPADADSALDAAPDLPSLVDAAVADLPCPPSDAGVGLPAADVPPASGPDAGATVAAPRLMAPLSTTRVTSQRPTLRWELPAGVPGARVELCADRACTRLLARYDATGSGVRPPAALAPGVVFWRAFGQTSAGTGTMASATWEFLVEHRDTPVDTSYGTLRDFDGDGYDDVAVSAEAFTTALFIYPGSPEGIMMPPIGLPNPSSFASGFGLGLGTGDLNGDGLADLTVNDFGDAVGVGGQVFIYLGRPCGLATLPSQTLVSPISPTTSAFGISSAIVGDLNGDGYGDLAASYYAAGDGSQVVGIYFGGPTGVPGTPSLVLPNATPGLGFGWALASAGDVNGDGYGDLVVGSTSGGGPGAAVVFAGGPAGPASTPAWRLPSPAGGDVFGWAVAGGGDVNGDGYGDLVVGAPGAAFVYLGSATGLGSVPTTTLFGRGGGPIVSNEFGAGLAVTGDYNGDGYADLVVGAPGEPYAEAPAPCCQGRAYFFPGSAAGISTTPALIVEGSMPTAGFGGLGRPIASLGDINGDGYQDLVISDYDEDIVNVYLGGVSGIHVAPDFVLTGPDGSDFGLGVAYWHGDSWMRTLASVRVEADRGKSHG